MTVVPTASVETLTNDEESWSSLFTVPASLALFDSGSRACLVSSGKTRSAQFVGRAPTTRQQQKRRRSFSSSQRSQEPGARTMAEEFRRGRGSTTTGIMCWHAARRAIICIVEALGDSR